MDCWASSESNADELSKTVITLKSEVQEKDLELLGLEREITALRKAVLVAGTNVSLSQSTSAQSSPQTSPKKQQPRNIVAFAQPSTTVPALLTPQQIAKERAVSQIVSKRAKFN
jgi:hypothetical protein